MNSNTTDKTDVYKFSSGVQFVPSRSGHAVLIFDRDRGGCTRLAMPSGRLLELILSGAVHAIQQQFPAEFCTLRERGIVVGPGGKAHLGPRLKDMNEIAIGACLKALSLTISHVCNFACPHCVFFGHALSGVRGSRGPRKMSWDIAQSAIDAFHQFVVSSGREKCQLTFGGGEPLTNTIVLRKAISYCRDFPNIEFRISVNTNLSLLGRADALFFAENNVDIIPSLDGMQHDNDQVRFTRDGKGTYALIVNKLKLLSECGVNPRGLSVTLTQNNLEACDERFMGFVSELGIEVLSVNLDLMAHRFIDAHQRTEKILSLCNAAVAKGLRITGIWDEPFESVLHGSCGFCDATMGRLIVVDVDGGVRLCPYSRDIVGTIHDLEEALSVGTLKKLRSREEWAVSNCGDCEIRGLCFGQCEVTREASELLDCEQRARLVNSTCSFYRNLTMARIRGHIDDWNPNE